MLVYIKSEARYSGLRYAISEGHSVVVVLIDEDYNPLCGRYVLYKQQFLLLHTKLNTILKLKSNPSYAVQKKYVKKYFNNNLIKVL